MADYDLKDIPTLDDVIEEKSDDSQSETAAPVTPAEPEHNTAADHDATEAETIDDDAHVDDEYVDDKHVDDEHVDDEHVDDEHIDDEHGADDITTDNNAAQAIEQQQQSDHLQAQDVQTQSFIPVVTEIVDINYQEVYDKSINSINTPTIAGSATTPTGEVPASEELPSEAPFTIEPIELEAIVNRAVTHLLPDLEQQLRFLVQRALEKQLPEALIKTADTGDIELSDPQSIVPGSDNSESEDPEGSMQIMRETDTHDNVMDNDLDNRQS